MIISKTGRGAYFICVFRQLVRKERKAMKTIEKVDSQFSRKFVISPCSFPKSVPNSPIEKPFLQLECLRDTFEHIQSRRACSQRYFSRYKEWNISITRKTSILFEVYITIYCAVNLWFLCTTETKVSLIWDPKYGKSVASEINSFVPNSPFIYPLKTSQNLTIFWCFQEVEKGWIGNEWVKNEIKKWQPSSWPSF